MTVRDHPHGARGIMCNMRKMVQTAEERDFSIAWFAGFHLGNYSSSPSPFMMCSCAAGWTKMIELGPRGNAIALKRRFRGDPRLPHFGLRASPTEPGSRGHELEFLWVSIVYDRQK
ncbi:LLM class flavin-dependent oxidoreductase [Methylovirgula sp. 4M-Z18]|nr:LLM class flavin-dependent oxidoreductase [Methylovirgula sp. 4M-Z18]